MSLKDGHVGRANIYPPNVSWKCTCCTKACSCYKHWLYIIRNAVLWDLPWQRNTTAFWTSCCKKTWCRGGLESFVLQRVQRLRLWTTKREVASSSPSSAILPLSGPEAPGVLYHTWPCGSDPKFLTSWDLPNTLLYCMCTRDNKGYLLPLFSCTVTRSIPAEAPNECATSPRLHHNFAVVKNAAKRQTRWLAGEEPAIVGQRCGQNSKYIYRTTRWLIKHVHNTGTRSEHTLRSFESFAALSLALRTVIRVK